MNRVLLRLFVALCLGPFFVPAGFAGEPVLADKVNWKATENAEAPAAAPEAKAQAAPFPTAPVLSPEEDSLEWSRMPATSGTLGLFSVEAGSMLARKGFSASGYINKFSRAPGSISVLNLGWSLGYGLADWFNVYLNFEPHHHVHAARPDELSLDSPITNPQFDNTIYRRLLASPTANPAYVEDYPFPFVSNGGVGEVALGVKFGLWSELRGNPVSLSVRNDFIIPTRTQLRDLLDDQSQSGTFNDYLALALSKNIGDAATAALNWGYRFTRDPRFNGLRPSPRRTRREWELGSCFCRKGGSSP